MALVKWISGEIWYTPTQLAQKNNTYNDTYTSYTHRHTQNAYNKNLIF